MMKKNQVITSKVFTTKEIIKVKPSAIVVLALGGLDFVSKEQIETYFLEKLFYKCIRNDKKLFRRYEF